MLEQTITRLRARRLFDQGLLLFLITAFGMTGVSRADVVTDSQSTTLTLTNLSQSVSLKKFDTTLGTLTGVAFELDASLSGQVSPYNSAQVAQQILSYTLADTTKASGTAVALSVNPQAGFTLPNPFTIDKLSNGPVLTVPTGSVVQATGTLAPADFAAYTGPAGQTAAFTVVGSNVLGSAVPSSIIATPFSLSENATLKVTYTYTPGISAVPEPSALHLAGLSLVVLGGWRAIRPAGRSGTV